MFISVPSPEEPTDTRYTVVDDGTGKPAPWFGGGWRLALFLVVLGVGGWLISLRAYR